MSTPKKAKQASPTRARRLPVWLIFLLVLALICICLPLTGTAAFVAFQQINGPAATGTFGAYQTLFAEATADSRERQQATALAATAALETQAAEDAAATTAAPAASSQTPTQTPTPTATVETPTPSALITLTLIECRGNDGLVFLDNSQGQAFDAFTTISFKLTPGTHHLKIVWTDDPDNNVETGLTLQKDTTFVYGDPCT